jgi:hypothetical protein
MKAPVRTPVCQGCKKALAGTYIQALGADWHPQCWCCAVCENPIQGAFVERGGRGYHPDCHAERFGLRCSICKGLLSGTYFQHEGKNICEQDYLARFAPRCDLCDKVLLGPFKVNAYGQRACSRHEKGPRCASCDRWLEDHERRLPALTEFGTVLCGHCGPRAIGLREAKTYDNAFGVAALKEVGVDFSPSAPVPIRLDTVAKVDGLKGPLDKGVCGLTQTQVSTIHGVVSERTVGGIVVVGGLAKEHFEGVLAHEFAHVWLFKEGLDQRAPALVEGFCELARYRWLGRLATPLAMELQRRMMENLDPIYGHGFRLTKERWDRSGIQGVLECLTR